jgi:TonB family protein
MTGPPRGKHGPDHFHEIDRNGRVLESHIIESSGLTDLDNELLSMLDRAQPLLKPPNDAQDVDLCRS